MSIKTYSIQRTSNIMELRNTYDDLLEEYYTLYKQYLGYKFSNNKTERTVTRTLDVPTYSAPLVGKTVDPKFANLSSEGAKGGCAPMCDAAAMEAVKNKCSMDPKCKGYTNYGELKSNVEPANLINFNIPVGGGPVNLYTKITTKQVIIPAAQLAKNAKGRLTVLKSKIDAILVELKQNISNTDVALEDHSAIVDKKRTEIVSRNREIQKQDKDLEAINLKLISRKRQNEFSLERNRYRKIMLVMLVIFNIILLGYFGYLLTGR